MEDLRKFDLQMFAYDDFDDDGDDDLESLLSDFDLDADDDTDLDMLPKKRVFELAKKRIQKERKKWEEKEGQFKSVFNRSLDDAIEFGRAAVTQAQAQPVVQPPTQPVQVPSQVATPTNPVEQKLAEIDQWRSELELRQQLEREATEFTRLYPGIKFEDIPQEVITRRRQGGLTLAESYGANLATNKKLQEDLVKRAAQTTARNNALRDDMRVEGPEYGGSVKDDIGAITEDEREFIRMYYGGDVKKYLKAQGKKRKYQADNV